MDQLHGLLHSHQQASDDGSAVKGGAGSRAELGQVGRLYLCVWVTATVCVLVFNKGSPGERGIKKQLVQHNSGEGGIRYGCGWGC